MTDENRRFSRIPFKINTELILNDTSYEVEEICNLSVGGCMLPLSLQAEPGTPCHIKIKLEGTIDAMSIDVEGEILRSEQDGVAVKFTRIAPDSLFHLQNIIRYNSPDADIIEFEISRHPGLK